MVGELGRSDGEVYADGFVWCRLLVDGNFTFARDEYGGYGKNHYRGYVSHPNYLGSLLLLLHLFELLKRHFGHELVLLHFCG